MRKKNIMHKTGLLTNATWTVPMWVAQKGRQSLKERGEEYCEGEVGRSQKGEWAETNGGSHLKRKGVVLQEMERR